MRSLRRSLRTVRTALARTRAHARRALPVVSVQHGDVAAADVQGRDLRRRKRAAPDSDAADVASKVLRARRHRTARVEHRAARAHRQRGISGGPASAVSAGCVHAVDVDRAVCKGGICRLWLLRVEEQRGQLR